MHFQPNYNSIKTLDSNSWIFLYVLSSPSWLQVLFNFKFRFFPGFLMSLSIFSNNQWPLWKELIILFFFFWPEVLLWILTDSGLKSKISSTRQALGTVFPPAFCTQLILKETNNSALCTCFLMCPPPPFALPPTWLCLFLFIASTAWEASFPCPTQCCHLGSFPWLP